MPLPAIRTGFGYDVHRLVEGRDLIIGGIKIPYHLGLLGHSDADVLTHALCDALLGAAGLGDIGRHFPDSDPAFAGISSIILLGHVMTRIEESGRWRLVNADMTLVAQKPKIAPYITRIRDNLKSAMGCSASQVNVKATTTEGLGFPGTGQGMAAYAVVLIEQFQKDLQG